MYMSSQSFFSMGFFPKKTKKTNQTTSVINHTRQNDLLRTKTLIIADINTRAAPVTLDVYAPKTFNTILSSSIPTSISKPTVSVTSITDRNRYMIKTNNTYINISDAYGVSFSTVLNSYKNFLTKVFQFVQDDSDTTCYRIDSELHSLYSLDYSSSSGKLVFTNNWGNGGTSSLSSTNGYLCFKYTSDKKLQVIKRYSYSDSDYTHSEDTSFAYANYYVKYSSSALTLVANSSNGSTFTIYNSKMNVSIPSDFNPIPTSYVSNDRVSIQDYVSNTRTNIEGTTLTSSDCKFIPRFYNNDGSKKVSDAGYYYANQLTNKGYDASKTGTNYYANLMLTQISSKVSQNTTYKKLRYPTSVYKAFREGALRIVLKSESIANADIGMNTTPYVYFTCEKDDSNQYHPFMCMASYSISDKPNRLADVCKPPGDGSGSGYAEQNVTRDATLQLYLTKIPMLNYGVVSETSISGSVAYSRTLDSTSNYYKTGVAISTANGTTTSSYYGSKTIITKVTSEAEDYLVVISDGDGFPAKCGSVNYTNDYAYERSWSANPNPLTEQCLIYKFRYRAGTNTTTTSNNDFTSLGVHGIFLNGVCLYNPSSGTGVIPGTSNTGTGYTNNDVISGDGTNQTTTTATTKYQLNAGFFKEFYGVDEAGGHPGDGGYIVDGKQGQYHYHNGTFITGGSWNNSTFASGNAYFSSNYYTDVSGVIDYIRHTDGHSKIVGYCFDGFPIYGPYGYSSATDNTSDITYMTSSYKTKTSEFSGRPYDYDYIATGTNTLTNQSYSVTISAGAFIDDYEYEESYGTLDEHNGRYCVTPDYPDGTYAYFISVDETINSTYPYIIGITSKQDLSFTDFYGIDDEQSYVTIATDSTSSGGSTTPTTGTAGEFDVSTLGVSSYSDSVTIDETYETNSNTNDMHSATLAYNFIEYYDENGNVEDDARIITSVNYNNYNYSSISGIGVMIDGVSLYPVLNNTLTTAHKSAEITTTGIHVGQGMGLHYHADGYSAKSSTNNLCLYNDNDYTKRYHPPLIGFGLDGIALYGIYKSNYSSMHGYKVALDSFGGHSHGNYGYHYHTHKVQNNTSNNIDTITDGSTATTYKIHVLMKGAWKGKINDIPDFWDSDHGSHSQYVPEYSLSTRSKYVWGYDR